MNEEEADVESSATGGADESIPAGEDATGRDPSASAASFVSLEEELRTDPDRAPIRTPTYGRIADARKIDRVAVPDDYPRSIRSERALAIDLVATDDGGRTVTAFFEWPPDGSGRLGRLLSAAGVGYDRFADLNGTAVLVGEEDGHYVPLLPEDAPGGSARGYLGLLAAQGVNVLLLGSILLGISTLGAGAAVSLLAILNLIVIPLATYLDARHLLTETSWDQGPAFWAFTSAIPFLNVFVSALYLRTRQRAKPLVRR